MAADIFKPFERRAYLFDDGIRFTCVQCGDCCTGDSGTIYVSGLEIDRIAAHLKHPVPWFIDHYLYPYKDSYSIREDDSGRCLFFEKGCRIYEVRPHQCRTFPFWFSNMRSERRWRRIRGQCPGIGQGRLYSHGEILSSAHGTTHI